MGQRWLKWLLVAAVLIVAVVGVRSCVDGGGGRGGNAPMAAPSAAQTSVPATDPSLNSAADAAARARIRQRDDAMYAAVGTLQRYLAALGGDDRAKADAFWADRRLSASGEADLRTLKELRGLRIENGTPKALDSEPVPAALEIPVTLRANPENGPMRRYAGWYRLRRAVVDGRWEITSASIDPLPPGQ